MAKKKTSWEKLDEVYELIIIVYTLVDRGVLDNEFNIAEGYDLDSVNDDIEAESGFNKRYSGYAEFKADVEKVRRMLTVIE